VGGGDDRKGQAKDALKHHRDEHLFIIHIAKRPNRSVEEDNIIGRVQIERNLLGVVDWLL
jgi:hypothetical protein